MSENSEAMPQIFIEKLRKDLAGRNEDFFKSLLIPKERIEAVLNGTVQLTRVEVIELARKLRQPFDRYIWLAGLQPEMFDTLDKNSSTILTFAEEAEISDKELDKLIDIMDTTLKAFLEKKLKEKQEKLKAGDNN